MSAMKNVVPSITINGKEYCINVGRDVIRALKYPTHICIMENDKQRMMAIIPCDESEVLSFKVPEGFPDNGEKKFRIYSQGLVNEIVTQYRLDFGNTYHLKGEISDGMNAVLFHLDEIGSR